MRFRVSAESFKTWALVVLAYNFLVIVWGGFVRASGSGAGCGDHWPLCNGQVLPREPEMQTLVEFAHRVTSGLCLITVLLLWLLARRSFNPKSPIRRFAGASFVLVVFEALIGALIVLLKLVGTDASLTRGVSISLHLVNTFVLTGALSLTYLFATADFLSTGAFKDLPRRLSLNTVWPYLIGLILIVFSGASGAIAALGDTLFPSQPFHAVPVLQADLQHIFLELRIVHPFVSLAGAAWWLGLSVWLGFKPLTESQSRFSLAVFLIFCFQVGLGFLNVALRAPIWMQMVHLFVANLVVFFSVCMSGSMCFLPLQKAQKMPVKAE